MDTTKHKSRKASLKVNTYALNGLTQSNWFKVLNSKENLSNRHTQAMQRLLGVSTLESFIRLVTDNSMALSEVFSVGGKETVASRFIQIRRKGSENICQKIDSLYFNGVKRLADEIFHQKYMPKSLRDGRVFAESWFYSLISINELPIFARKDMNKAMRLSTEGIEESRLFKFEIDSDGSPVLSFCFGSDQKGYIGVMNIKGEDLDNLLFSKSPFEVFTGIAFDYLSDDAHERYLHSDNRAELHSAIGDRKTALIPPNKKVEYNKMFV